MKECVSTQNYKISVEYNHVKAVSMKYIPFEPKGWQKDFRDELRKMLRSELKPVDASCLMASYSGAGVGVSDVENLLFYNIGAASFSHLKANELRMETDISAPMPSSEFQHQYSYRVVEQTALTEPEWKYDLAAYWDDVKTNGFRGEKKPLDFWLPLLLNPERIHIIHSVLQGHRFGVEIFLTIPADENLNLTGVIKPLLDGVICAFHGADATLQKEAGNIAERLKIPKELLCQTHCVLGESCYVNLYRNGVKWAPQDDRCTAARLVIRHGSTSEYRFSGKIYMLDENSICRRIKRTEKADPGETEL